MLQNMNRPERASYLADMRLGDGEVSEYRFTIEIDSRGVYGLFLEIPGLDGNDTLHQYAESTVFDELESLLMRMIENNHMTLRRKSPNRSSV